MSKETYMQGLMENSLHVQKLTRGTNIVRYKPVLFTAIFLCRGRVGRVRAGPKKCHYLY